MVFMLYYYLWKSHTLERGLRLLDSPHHHPHEQSYDFDSVNMDVMYSFRRRNGFFVDKNSSNSTTTVPPGPSSVNSKAGHGHASNQTKFSLSHLPLPCECVHAFYYMWYGNPVNDGKYYHWNHRYLPHWDSRITKQYRHLPERHVPPEDIGAGFYPQLGCYSSKDPVVMESHMYQLRLAGVGVVSVSWYPPGKADDEGIPPDPLLPLILDIAQMYFIKVAIHIEPYKGRSPNTVREDLRYIMDNYSSHPAFYKYEHNVDGEDKLLPMVYIYDSYITKANEWAELLKPDAPNSIRGTELDCVVIGLLVEGRQQQSILDGGFDGFYTYFAANGFSYGSSTINWKALATFAKKNGLFFIPSFGPGYSDVRVRPWNQANTKHRNNGQYYQDMFQAAVRNRVGPRGKQTGIVSLTSFNEWHEGSQIESAVPKNIDGYTYEDYQPNQPEFYLQLTREIATKMQCRGSIPA
jgi:glycoprotein endo-alpha-1,2-mannosidase